MKPYITRAGKAQYKPSFDELEACLGDGHGFCVGCGHTQAAEPDAVRHRCDHCGESRVYGPETLGLMGLAY